MNRFCFANQGGECAALIQEKACCRGCRFFKSKSKAEADQKHALELIAAKPHGQQKRIARKYYQGAMPWRKEE